MWNYRLVDISGIKSMDLVSGKKTLSVMRVFYDREAVPIALEDNASPSAGESPESCLHAVRQNNKRIEAAFKEPVIPFEGLLIVDAYTAGYLMEHARFPPEDLYLGGTAKLPACPLVSLLREIKRESSAESGYCPAKKFKHIFETLRFLDLACMAKGRGNIIYAVLTPKGDSLISRIIAMDTTPPPPPTKTTARPNLYIVN